MIKNITVKPTITIREAMKKLNLTGTKCLVVIDKQNNLLGTLSDGDLRKAILGGIVVNDTIKYVYQSKPYVLVVGKYSPQDAKKLFIKHTLELIPIVDDEGKLFDILLWKTVFKNGENKQYEKMDVPVVIMAGGRGSRMEPFTTVLPKPLVPIQDKPIIEHIIESFTKLGCTNFYLTVNYKSRIIKAYFEELQPDYMLSFVEEQEPLGTAGSLRLLDRQFREPFFVTNCDIMIKADYASIYKFHKDGGYDVTLVASTKEFVIPYGSCELNGDGHLSHINEKPTYNYLINTGLYILNPEILKLIPEDKFYHLTHLIEEVKNQGNKVGVFPIDDDAWIDVGRWAEYQKAVEHF